MKYLFIVMSCFCMFTAHAQHQLTGTVKAQADDSPVPYATAALLRPDSSVVTGVTTNDAGRFVLENVKAGDYLVQISFIGYQKEYRAVKVPSQSELGEITLAESVNQLAEVVVKASVPFISQHADKYVVNVSSHIQSAGRDAVDLLRYTPGVLVGSDGTISALGKEVAVWIDGRPSHLSGEQLQTMLSATQAESIDKIEVITNPSSKYDAEGVGGIINIRTKKGLQYGLNGALTLGYKQGRKDTENTGLSLNYRKERINLYGNYNIERSNEWTKIEQDNTMPTTEGLVDFLQTTEQSPLKADMNLQYKVGADLFLDPKNTIGIFFSGYNGGFGESEILGTTVINPALDHVDYSTMRSVAKSVNNSQHINLNYQTEFDNSGQLGVDFDFARFFDKASQTTHNDYFNHSVSLIDTEQIFHTNPQTIHVYSAKIDYTQSIGENTQVEVGGKISHSETDNDFRYDTYQASGWQTDDNISNHFVYTENISAAYINLNQSFGQFDIQAGLRGEYTKSTGEQFSTDEKNDTSYFNLFPTLFLNYQLSEKHYFGLSYSRRLTRPNYAELNPFEIKIDAFSYVAGNPDLTPSYSHDIGLSYTFNQKLMAQLSYTHITEGIIQSPVFDTERNLYGLVPHNFGTSEDYALMLNYMTNIGNFWQVVLTGQGMYQKTHHTDYKNDKFSYVLSVSNDFEITPSLSVELSGLYYSKLLYGYYETKPTGSLSLGIRKMLFNDRLSVSLNFEDVLYTLPDRFTANYDGASYTGKQYRDSRCVSINLKFNFGSETVKKSRDHSSGIEEEMGRVK